MLDVLKAGSARAEEIIANVKPAQFGEPTPCAEFDVRALLNHIVGGQYFLAAVATGKPMDSQDHGTAPDLIGDDPVVAFRKAAEANMSAWSTPGVIEGKVDFPGMGEMGGASGLGVAIMEIFVHGWDLAKATGQDPTIPAEVASVILAAFERNPLPDKWRTPQANPFGAAVTVPDGASPSDKLVAYLGRTP